MPKRSRLFATFAVAACTGGLLLFSSCGGGAHPLPTTTPTPTAELNALLNLERFHYAATLTLRNGNDTVAVSTEGDFQSPDRHAFTYKTQFPGYAISTGAVVIGKQVWLKRGDAAWQAVDPAEQQTQQLFSTAFSPIRPDFLGGPDFRNARNAVRRLSFTTEFINDIRSLHYQVGAEGQRYLQSFLADQDFLQQVQDPHWDVWLAADGGWPVRLLASATITADLPVLHDLGLAAPAAWEVRIDISRPNDPQINIQPPI